MVTKLAPREPRRLAPRSGRDPLTAFREEMDQFLSRFMGGPEEEYPAEFAPRLDLSETDQAIEIEVDLPGVKPKDIDIQVSGNTLTISGERKTEEEEEGKIYHYAERRTRRFWRAITLPCPVQEAKIEAQNRCGVLMITLPKVEAAKPRKIEIKT